jgi:protoporphyrinogen oxidase
MGTAFVALLKYLTRPKLEIVSAEDFFVSTYGKKVYDLFFKKYTQRVWGVPPPLIDRKFFYKRVPSLNLFQLLLRALFGPLFIKKAQSDDQPGYAYDIRMIYPNGGCGIFPQNLSKRITALGGHIYLNTSVTSIIHDNDTIKSISIFDGKTFSQIACSYCISTIPITSFVKCLKPKISQLYDLTHSLFYRAIIIVCLIINKEHISDFQTIYFYDNIFTRIGFMNNFSLETCPPGKTAITAEITCFEGDEIWNSDPEKLKDVVVKELVDLGFFLNSDVGGYTTIKEKFGYPVLKVGDIEKLHSVFDILGSFRNLSIIGRQGRFDYIQMADAVREGLSCSEEVISYFHKLDGS